MQIGYLRAQPRGRYNAARMSKDALIAELARLSPQELAEVRAWIEHRAPGPRASAVAPAGHGAPRLRSPRLADPSQAGDFKKQVTELPANAAL